MSRPLEALEYEQSWRSSGWDTVRQVKFPEGCMVAGISVVPGVFRNLTCKCFVRMLMETVGANSSTEDPRSPTDYLVTAVIGEGLPATAAPEGSGVDCLHSTSC